MSARTRLRRPPWPLVLLVGAATIATPAAVIASSQDDTSSRESGTSADVRYANPPRASAPDEVASGSTSDGRPYKVLVSRALTGDICVAIRFGAPTNPSARTGPGSPGGGEACGPGTNGKLPYLVPQQFVDPATGAKLDQPLAFAVGLTDDAATKTSVVTANGETSELKLTSVAGKSYKVFAGSLPRDVAVGQAEIVTRRASGTVMDRAPANIGGPAHQSDAEAQKSRN